MFNKGDVVIVKQLDELIKNGYLKKAEDLGDVYCNRDKKYVLFPDFPYYGVEAKVDEVDEDDKDIPYFLSVGIWVPEFMIINKPEPKPVIEPIAVAMDKVKKQELEPKKYINKFNNKPFGVVFLKLIALDEKVAEFSNTVFGKLKKHELRYIAKLLQDNGAQVVDYNKLTQKELAVYCYTEALKL